MQRAQLVWLRAKQQRRVLARTLNIIIGRPFSNLSKWERGRIVGARKDGGSEEVGARKDKWERGRIGLR